MWPPCGQSVSLLTGAPMDNEFILNRFDDLSIWKQGEQLAPHKPLLVLYALGRWQRGDTGDLPFDQLAPDVAALPKVFGPPRRPLPSRISIPVAAKQGRGRKPGRARKPGRGTETGTGTVLMAIHGINRCYAKNSESSTRGVLFINGPTVS
jgi:hypothetical protein